MIERLFYLLEVIWAMLFVWWWVMGSICQKEPFIFSPFTVKVFPLVRRQDLCSMKVLWILGLHRVPGPGGCSQCKGKPKASWWAWAISGFQTKIKYNGLNFQHWTCLEFHVRGTPTKAWILLWVLYWPSPAQPSPAVCPIHWLWSMMDALPQFQLLLKIPWEELIEAAVIIFILS